MIFATSELPQKFNTTHTKLTDVLFTCFENERDSSL